MCRQDGASSPVFGGYFEQAKGEQGESMGEVTSIFRYLLTGSKDCQIEETGGGRAEGTGRDSDRGGARGRVGERVGGRVRNGCTIVTEKFLGNELNCLSRCQDVVMNIEAA